MARFIHPYKIHPEKARAWTMEETKIPHRPNSASRPSRRDFPIPVVVNPAFQQQFHEPTETVDEDDMEPTLMEAPQAQGPRRVTKRENINVIRECEWDVKDIQDESVGGKTPLNKPLVVLLTVVCLTSTVSLILTLLILSGSAGTRICSCNDGAGFGSTSAQKSEDEDRIETVSKNITTLDKKMEEKIQQLERRIPNEELFRKEMVKMVMTLLNNQTAELVERVTTQEKLITNLTRRLQSTILELKKVESALVGQSDGLKNATDSITGLLGEQRNIWKRVNATIEETAYLTIKVDQEFRNVWRGLNESKLSLLTNMTSQLKDLQSKTDEGIETVWFNLNKTRKCCNNLTLSFVLFRTNVDHRSQRLEARIEVEEQKSNSTRQIMELHFQKIQDLNGLLNITRQNIKNVSREHSTALSVGRNLSRREFHGVWTALNATTNDLLGQIQKAADKLTEQINQTQVLLQSSDASLFASLIHLNTSITEKVNNVSKMAGPIGPPGSNGSQGPAGPSGAIGPPGPQGSGNFSECQYTVETGTLTPGHPKALASKTEPDGKKIMGATCSTNYAAEYNLKSQQQPSGKWIYVCDCRGTAAKFSPRRDETKNCYLHYWECPLTT